MQPDPLSNQYALADGQLQLTTFAGRLRTARVASGVSQYRLAQLTGISKQGIINLEKPDADPKLSTLVKVAAALKVRPWDLLPGLERPTPVDQPSCSCESETFFWKMTWTGLMAVRDSIDADRPEEAIEELNVMRVSGVPDAPHSYWLACEYEPDFAETCLTEFVDDAPDKIRDGEADDVAEGCQNWARVIERLYFSQSAKWKETYAAIKAARDADAVNCS